ncbi:PLD nuclease N-terminal domain-containing protein [uncultured Gimesia sp.]|uniref:PLD nuclease N-terminal domain-containing protein n=1 Tax=uncultured Gimesia sp. TaxID=1678688 RepID=UPI0030D9D074
MFGILELLFVLLSVVIGVLATVFWVWMLIDCLKNEPSMGNDKIIWALVIVFLSYLGAILYYLVRRPERMKQTGQ